MKRNKLYTALISSYNLFMIIISVVIFIIYNRFDILEMGYTGINFWTILFLVIIFLYTLLLIEATIDNRENKKCGIVKEKTSSKKIKRIRIYWFSSICYSLLLIVISLFATTGFWFCFSILMFIVCIFGLKNSNKRYEKGVVYTSVDDRITLIGVWILFMINGLSVFCFAPDLRTLVIFLLIFIFLYSLIVWFIMNIKKITKMNWSLKDCVLVLSGFIIIIVLTVVFFVNCNSIGDSMPWKIPHFIFLAFYFEYLLLPFLGINIYNLIRINENNKKEKLNNN